MTRDQYEEVIDHVLERQQDSITVLRARKKFFMDLFDICYDDLGRKLQTSDKSADGSEE